LFTQSNIKNDISKGYEKEKYIGKLFHGADFPTYFSNNHQLLLRSQRIKMMRNVNFIIWVCQNKRGLLYCMNVSRFRGSIKKSGAQSRNPNTTKNNNYFRKFNKCIGYFIVNSKLSSDIKLYFIDFETKNTEIPKVQVNFSNLFH